MAYGLFCRFLFFGGAFAIQIACWNEHLGRAFPVPIPRIP
jgi:hypothetical protein